VRLGVVSYDIVGVSQRSEPGMAATVACHICSSSRS